jgi:CHAT domain-containing protein
MTRRIGLVVPAILFLAAGLAVSALAKEPPGDSAELKAALAASRSGAPDAAIAQLRQIAAKNEKTNPREAASAHFYLAELFVQSGQNVDAVNESLAAVGLAVGTDLEPLATCQVNMVFARLSLEKGLIGVAWSMMDSAEKEVPKLPAIHREGNESTLLGMRTTVLVQAIDAFEAGEPTSAALPPDVQRFLAQLFDPATALPAKGDAPLPLESLMRIDRRQPWRPKLIDKALQLTERMLVIDRRQTGDLAQIELAKDQSFKAELLEKTGRTDAEVENLRKQALAVFQRYRIPADTLIELNKLADLQMRRKTPESTIEAFRLFSQLMALADSEMQGMVGATAAQFQQRWHAQYRQQMRILDSQYKSFLEERDTKAAQYALEALLLQADSWSFRPLRQDVLLYQRLRSSSGPNKETGGLVEASWSDLVRAKEQAREAEEAGKLPEDYGRPGQFVADSPFAGLTVAKSRMVTAIQDKMRIEKGKLAVTAGPTKGMLKSLQEHMGPEKAVLIYLWNPGTTELRAVVLDATQVHVISLGDVSDDVQRQLVARAAREISQQRPEAKATLEEIAKVLVWPLGQLPRRLVIVLPPELLGIPFEALPGTDGAPLVAQHDIFYSIGLSASLATPLRVSLKRAFVVGAERSRVPSLPALEESGVEVAGIRRLVSRTGGVVDPVEPLPATPLLALQRPGSYDVVHVSSHALLDSDTPMLDALAFPGAEVYPFDILGVGFGAKLTVLSACSLFKPRADGVNPFSGITTAFFARVAPYVVSPLWPVNGQTTTVFMIRFYEELASSSDPTAALAAAKRAFLSPDALVKWARARKLALTVAPEQLSQPYYWAPFLETFVPAAERPL